MKFRIHINAVKAEVDQHFSEKVEGREPSPDEHPLGGGKIDGVIFFFKKTDTRNVQKLKELAERKLSQFLNSHLDNSFSLFIEKELRWAKDRQSYFPNYLDNNTDKEYYFFLQRWIDYLRQIEKSDPSILFPVLFRKEDHTSKATEEKLLEEMSKYGFSDLPSVSVLSKESQVELVRLMVTNGLAYAIAMFDHLGFLKLLSKKYFETIYERNCEIARWFDSDTKGRSVRGMTGSLHKPYVPGKGKRYNANKYIETVKEDYQKLK